MNKSIPGYVYLVHAVSTNRYKIGRCVNLQTRLKRLQNQSPYPLKMKAAFATSNSIWDEAYWHQAYKEYRVYGEWFEFPDYFINDGTKFCFWSRYDEFRIVELARELAKAHRVEIEIPCIKRDQSKYFDEAIACLGVGNPYRCDAHLEVQ